MRKVSRKELLSMENVLYFPYVGGELPFSPFNIKYATMRHNDWVCEEFPIAVPNSDVTGVCGDSFEHERHFEDEVEVGVDVPVSDFETRGDGMYENDDYLYIVYSKDDIRTMIKKLEALLED